ncbi:bleomycin resistance protein [Brevibacillus laterosporus]|uniref:Bleomycin resistance protein n=1 Tax=Brevibacillus laterosporus TaxID=1465 RepID=A0A0F7EF31_BRELA|nr:bleomycin resistance protein [Brevibacillus laterosporus]
MRMMEAIPALPITDMRKSEDFYRDKLGFTVIYHEGGFAILKCHHVEIHLWIASDESWRNRNDLSLIVSDAESFITGTAGCRIRVENIDELYQRIQPLDILHSNGHVKEQPWGDRDFSVLDSEQ